MINADMRYYNYFTLGEKDAYGQQTLSNTPTGKIKMAINVSNQNIQGNFNYKDAQYIGLTLAEVNDSFVIEYKNEKLKVLYTVPFGRYTQVFLAKR